MINLPGQEKQLFEDTLDCKLVSKSLVKDLT